MSDPMRDRNPQARQMADESMIRNLTAQAEAIWPQELPIVQAHDLPAAPDILDVGTGTGEIASRLARVFPAARVLGVDIIEEHLALARKRYADLGQLTFQRADAFELPFAPASFDLVVNRHMLQAIPHPERVLAEMVRVARPGATLHIVPEDYDMIHVAMAASYGSRPDVGPFWRAGPRAYGAKTGTDLFIGRNIYYHLRKLGLEDIAYHYAMVDTLRVPRETFATIFEAWRDGYVEAIAPALGRAEAEVREAFEATIDCIRDPDGYALWVVPIVTARVPR